MYYQVLIETSERVGKAGGNKQYFELDKTDLTEIEERIVYPFLRKEDFQFDGYFLKVAEIKRITIKETQKTTQELSQYENDNMPAGIIMFVSPKEGAINLVGVSEVLGRAVLTLCKPYTITLYW